MPATVQFKANGNNIHRGQAYPFINILRPGYGMHPLFTGIPPKYADPADPTAWSSGATGIAVGDLLVPLASPNGLAYRATNVVSGVGDTTEPTWPTVIGATVVENSDITWQCVGPTWKWAASQPAYNDQQVRDSKGNIQIALNSGTTGASEPTWSTVFGAVTSDNGVQWLNMGATKGGGANMGDIVFDMSPTMMEADADGFTSALRKDVTKEAAKITGTLREFSLTVVRLTVPNATYASGTDPKFSTGVQAYEEIGFGGNLNVISPCVCVVSPKPNVADSYFRGWLNKAVPAGGGGGWPFAFAKYSDFKMDFEGLSLPDWPAGWQIARLVSN